MKKLVLTLCVLCAMAAGAYAQNVSDFETEVENGAVTITGYKGSAKDLVIPAAINGLPVTTIGYGAFEDCSSLTTVTIPSSVTEIEEGAFNGCSSLTTVTIPSSVTEIGGWAFYGCSSLTTVTIPSSVTNIGSAAFFDCNLKQATRAEIIRRFGNWPFEDFGG